MEYFRRYSGHMLTGRIRPIETRMIDVTEVDHLDRPSVLSSELTAGWEIKDVGRGVIQRTDGVKQIEGADIDAIRAKVPKGWQLLSVQAS